MTIARLDAKLMLHVEQPGEHHENMQFDRQYYSKQRFEERVAEEHPA